MILKSKKITYNSFEIDNEFISVFIDNYVKKFRNYNLDEFNITIIGLKKFITKDNKVLIGLLETLKRYDFIIENEGNVESIYNIDIICNNVTKNTSYSFKYQVQNLTAVVELSSKTNIPVVGIIIINVVAQIISRLKILYKAIVLDLDDTLWLGTLTEDGIERIRENMITSSGFQYIEFMKFVKRLGVELGFYIAICSRNDSKMVESAIEKLDYSVFPLKNQIDCIIANNNDKSENIRLIAEKLSIMPSSVVFIDDNQIVRDEVKSKLQDVFVPEWNNHMNLVTKLIASCAFERNELSLNSQNRRRQYRIIQAERQQNSLPKLFIKVFNDEGHIESIKLYTKSNQFKFSNNDDNFGNNSQSLYFEIIRENGDNLGICSAITYSQKPNSLYIKNLALSCRYFGIGLEEYILLFIKNLTKNEEILIEYIESENNEKVRELLVKYPDIFHRNGEKNEIEIILTKENADKIKQNTKLSTL